MIVNMCLMTLKKVCKAIWLNNRVRLFFIEQSLREGGDWRLRRRKAVTAVVSTARLLIRQSQPDFSTVNMIKVKNLSLESSLPPQTELQNPFVPLKIPGLRRVESDGGRIKPSFEFVLAVHFFGSSNMKNCQNDTFIQILVKKNRYPHKGLSHYSLRLQLGGKKLDSVSKIF